MDDKNAVLRVMCNMAIVLFTIVLLSVGRQQSAYSRGITERDGSVWNIYIYMDARNVLGRRGEDAKTLKQIVSASKDARGVVVYVDDIREKVSRCYKIRSGAVKKIKGCGNSLNGFLTVALGRRNNVGYNMLVLWGTADTNFFGVKGKTAVSWKEVGEEIVSSEKLWNRKVDVLLIDACRGYSLLSLIGLYGSSDYLIASPWEVPIGGFPYSRIIKKAEPLRPVDMAVRVAKYYLEAYRDSGIGVSVAVVNFKGLKKSELIGLAKEICKSRQSLSLKKPLGRRIGRIYIPVGFWLFGGDKCQCGRIIHEINMLDVFYGRTGVRFSGYRNVPVMPAVKVFVKKCDSDGEMRFYIETMGNRLGKCFFRRVVLHSLP